MQTLAGKNPGNLIKKIIKDKKMVDKIKDELDYTVRQTVVTQLNDFQKFNGILKTYIKYCDVFNFKLCFLIKNKDQEYEGEKLDEILEEIRKDSGLTKKKFAKEKLNLTDYNYTFRTFERNTGQFSKIHDIFEDKLGFELNYILKKS
jgi:hypothetical protein